MSYVPWPREGCSIAEARERTVDLAFSSKKRKRTKTLPAETEPQTKFLTYLQKQQLFAYGRPADLASGRSLIHGSDWLILRDISWDKSLVRSVAPGRKTFADILVYPLALAPCRLELLAGRTLAQAFRQCMLEDPEVVALSKIALEISPEFSRVFVDGHCYFHGRGEWPLEEDRDVTGVIHPDREKRGPVGYLGDAHLQPVADAADALTDRYREFLGLLRRRELVGRGISARTGQEGIIPHSLWSHKDFWLSARRGDVLEINLNSSNPTFDSYFPCWKAVFLEQPSLQSVETHIKSTAVTDDGPASSASKDLTKPFISQTTSPRQIRTSNLSYRACVDWLIIRMKASPKVRPKPKSDWWQEADLKWPGTLSRRSFDDAWDEAIKRSGASWFAPGAPKGSRNPRT